MRLCGAWEGGDAGWAKELEDNAKAVDFFNHGESPAQVTMAWSDLGLTGKQYVRDLWRQQDFGTVENDFIATVPRPGVALVRISKRRENQLPLLSPMPIPFQKQSNIS